MIATSTNATSTSLQVTDALRVTGASSTIAGTLNLGSTTAPGAAGSTITFTGGASLSSDQTGISIPAEPVKVADTIGAGDAFNAGFLAVATGVDIPLVVATQIVIHRDLHDGLAVLAQ